MVFMPWLSMPHPYAKPYCTVEEQIILLKERGMMITDEEKAKAFLGKIGYYRLSGYWYPFRELRGGVGQDGKPAREVLDSFKKGTEFHHAVDLYVFDKRLRLLLLDALERIEVALRVDVAYTLGKYSPSAYREAQYLDGRFVKRINPRTALIENHHQEWLSRFDSLAARSREDFVVHYNQKYDSPLPIWIAVELWDFGLLSRFMTGMRYVDSRAISRHYGIERPELLMSWMRSLNLVRNICAHHSRIWNRSLVDSPRLPKPNELPLFDHLVCDPDARYRLYYVAAIMKFLLNTINPTTTWGMRMKLLFDTFPHAPSINLAQTGFPENWADLPLWRARSR